MISVSDILKILDQVPVWKTLTALPKRLRDLEERVAKLEGRPAAKPADACPICGEAMKVTASRPHPLWGSMAGIKEQTLTCTSPDCGHTDTREFDPAKG